MQGLLAPCLAFVAASRYCGGVSDRRVIVALSVCLAASLLAVAFLLGRESGRSPQPVMTPAPVAPPLAAAPPPAPEPEPAPVPPPPAPPLPTAPPTPPPPAPA